MTNDLTLLLRSRRLALWLLVATATLAIFGTLPLPEIVRVQFIALPGLVVAARALGLIDTYRSPLFIILIGVLGVNIVLCTWQRIFRQPGSSGGAAVGTRRRARLLLDVLVHLSLLAIVAGGVAKGVFGFVRTRNIYVGESTDVFFDFSRDADVPLGFSFKVLEREDTYYPLEALIGVSDRASSRKIELLELREGRPVELTGGGLVIAVDKLDASGKLLRLRATTDGRTDTAELQLTPGATGSYADVGSLRLALVAWKRELKGVRSRVACHENGALTREGWISPQGRLACRGVNFAQTAYGVDEAGKPFVGIQAVREPAAPLFWGGCIVFTLALPLFQVVRQDRWSAFPDAGGDAGGDQNSA